MKLHFLHRLELISTVLSIDPSDGKIFRISSDYSILLPYSKFALIFFYQFSYTYLKSGKKAQ